MPNSTIDGVKLKPCPKCGAEPCYVTGGFPEPWVCCSNDECASPIAEGKTMDEAGENWNARLFIEGKH